MNIISSSSLKSSLLHYVSGPFVTVLTIVMIELLARASINIPNPPVIYFVAVVYSAFTGGVTVGLISGSITLLYAAYFFSIPGNLFHYSPENLRRLIVLFITTPVVALMTGILKRQNERSQKENSEREKLLSIFIEHAPASLAMFDRQMRYINASRCWTRDYGLNDRDLRGFSHYEIFPEIPDRWKAIHRRALAGEVVVNDQDRFERADGSVQWLKWEVRPWYDASGDVGGIVIFSEDITKRKLAEETLHQLNEQLEQRVIQKTRFYSLVGSINQAIVRHRDRRKLLSEVCKIIVETGNFRLAWVGILDTASGEVKSEESCGETSYLDGIRIIAADVPEGRGPTGRSIAENRHIINSDFEEDPNMLPWRERARAHGIRSSSAFPLHSDGQVIGALTLYSEEPSFFTDEEISLLLSITDNISFALDAIAAERKRLEAEEALRRLNEELEQRVAMRTSDLKEANKELEAFSYSVSHDLRAPLRHMSGFVELLQKRSASQTDDQLVSCTNAIGKASKKMGRLIDDLLEFSRIGRSELKRRKVSLNTLVQDVVREVTVDAKGRDIDWKISELPDVYGDSSLLRLTIVNLISNAVKYTGKRDHAEISIGCREEMEDFVIFIRDNGVGFDMKYVDRLFGVFQRLHAQGEFEGTGIGLANVKRIISRHGGRTWADGAVGQGATFYFALPKIKKK